MRFQQLHFNLRVIRNLKLKGWRIRKIITTFGHLPMSVFVKTHFVVNETTEDYDINVYEKSKTIHSYAQQLCESLGNNTHFLSSQILALTLHPVSSAQTSEFKFCPDIQIFWELRKPSSENL